MYSCLDGDVEDGVASAPLVETVAAQGSSRSGLSSSDLAAGGIGFTDANRIPQCRLGLLSVCTACVLHVRGTREARDGQSEQFIQTNSPTLL